MMHDLSAWIHIYAVYRRHNFLSRPLLTLPNSPTTMSRFTTRLRRLGIAAITSGTGVAGLVAYNAPPRPTIADREALAHGGLEVIPSRTEQLASLKAASTPDNQLDILVIGGGATGTAACLDATLRDLKVGLVERDDFASGTSSRSTKLIHGGVRYLEKAFFKMDPGQLQLVFEALHERKMMLDMAPHLTHPLPTILPCYKWWEVPFYYLGLKAYDFVAFVGSGLLCMSKFVQAKEALLTFPTLAKESMGQRLRGSIVYYDGQMDDARFNVGSAITSAMYGAAVANHTEVIDLITNSEKNQVVGARVRDVFTGEEFDIYAKVVINATGPFTDGVRKMEDPDANPMIVPSAGVHITLPDYYSADGMGLIVPKTKDGRVVFMLPWLGRTIAGTTDSSTKITALPVPHEEEVNFILDALSDYLRIEVRKDDIQSSFSGIRPLAVNPDQDTGSTQNILRHHAVHVSPKNVVTITGGKWTTQRAMGEAAVDKAIEIGSLESIASNCKTPFVKLVGAHKYDPSDFTFLVQQRTGPERLDLDVAKNLSRAYGDQAYKVLEISEDPTLAERLVKGHPILCAEIVHCVRNEYCQTVVDFIARRSRLAFLDARAAHEAVPKVVEIMGKELGWSSARKKQEVKEANEFLATFTCGMSNGIKK